MCIRDRIQFVQLFLICCKYRASIFLSIFMTHAIKWKPYRWEGFFFLDLKWNLSSFHFAICSLLIFCIVHFWVFEFLSQAFMNSCLSLGSQSKQRFRLGWTIVLSSYEKGIMSILRNLSHTSIDNHIFCNTKKYENGLTTLYFHNWFPPWPWHA